MTAILAGPALAGSATGVAPDRGRVAEALAASVFARAPAQTLPVLYRHAPPALPPGVARTAVERRSQGDGVVGAAGLLCGMTPIADGRGAASTRGYDPQGRFIGARLAFAF